MIRRSRALVGALVLALAVSIAPGLGVAQPASAAPAASTTVVAGASVPTGFRTTTTTGKVKRIVDGDTVVLTSGSKVRLIGIDTPERGEYGYSQATAFAKKFLIGHTVTVTKVLGRDDKDRYGRLLRYLSVKGKDYGLTVITSGWAIARYDGRTGYGSHPLQKKYIAADKKHAMPKKKSSSSSSKKPSRTGPVSAWNCPSWAPIKGNANSMIYHLPGQRYYSKTKPEDCFRSESAAVKAGYRRAKV